MQPSRLTATLRHLSASEIQFILVGGLAAVLHGAPIHTYDVDIVYSRDDANLERILRFLEETEAIFRIQPDRRLRPGKSHLSGRGHLNLMTSYGPLDLLATIGAGLGYPDLLPHSEKMDISEGLRIQVLDLETVISIKEKLASEKDLAVLPILRQTLIQKQKNPRA
jgi:hypothetical protein